MSVDIVLNHKAQNVILRIDGCSLGNPGPAGIGVIIESENGEMVIKRSKALGIKTNNEAEYMALIEGLKLASRFKDVEVTVYSDSLLLVKQMRGEYKVSDKMLKELYLKVRKLQNNFRAVSYVHVSRNANSKADWLAKEAAKKNASEEF